MNYQPQLVSKISAINSISFTASLAFFWGANPQRFPFQQLEDGMMGSTPQKTNQCPLERGHFKRNSLVFQPLFFRKHVSFLNFGGITIIWHHFLPVLPWRWMLQTCQGPFPVSSLNSTSVSKACWRKKRQKKVGGRDNTSTHFKE